ncbi:hypothetical protein DRQ12_00320 [candidate division KSB1 bacterium]|nr:MAG: hypothetical protein DRQ12_00320 [candidate division KSB1 bacterium]
MIVKMQKVTLLVGAQHREDALNKLRKLGVIHVHYVKNPVSKDITSLENELSDLEKALSVIGEGKKPSKNVGTDEASAYVKEILSLSQQKTDALQKLEELEEKRNWFDYWGAISRNSVEDLEKAGIFIHLYVTNKNALKKLPEDKIVYVVREEKNTAYVVFISTDPNERLDFKEELIPEIEIATLEKNIAQIKKEITHIERRLNELSKKRDHLIAYRDDLIKKLEFSKVKYSMGEEETIYYLQGFCPNESISEVKKTAHREGWAYIFEDPDNPHEVPTLIRNPKWLRIIDPVFKFMGTLPGYNEYDISFWFLLFFSIFFAMLIGDAGYGLLILLLSLFAQKKIKNAPKEPFFLIYVLSGTTIIWGAITGTWFGFEKIAQLPFLNFLVIDKINSFIDTNQLFMMHLCFLIGVIQLTVAHGIVALRYINSPITLSQIGWIGILWGLFFVAGKLVLNKPLPGFSLVFLVGGIGLVVLFSNFQKNIVKGILISLGDIPLKVISSFSDIVSYLRLFAVGYATVIVASNFNNMAAQTGFHSIINSFIAALILLGGHSLNILLGLMAVIVHGIRLNMLEFSGHLNMQWSGKPYEPFKE